jgi:hypothetical protein
MDTLKLISREKFINFFVENKNVIEVKEMINTLKIYKWNNNISK